MKKEKYLNSAIKYIQRGQLDRAIKDYEQVVALDPKDVRHRQKLAELLVRCNRTEEALKEYETIGKFYADNGFYLKAIAVYKQIQRIDPTNVAIAITLGSINEKHGLKGNALAEYKTAVDYYEKAGLLEDSVRILEKMLSLDPYNVNIEIKLAESCKAAGLLDQSYGIFTNAARTLKKRGETQVYEHIIERIRQLFPDRTGHLLDLYEEQLKEGDYAVAKAGLIIFLATDRKNARALDLLRQAYQKAGDSAALISLCTEILDYFPANANAQETLIEQALNTDDFRGASEFVDRFAPDFTNRQSYELLERYYNRLNSLNPGDSTTLEGLKRLYQASGELVKLADIEDRLSMPGPQPSGSHTPVPQISTAPPAPDPGQETDTWTDEIAVNIPDEDEVQDLPIVIPAVAQDGAVPEPDDEISLAIELQEEEIETADVAETLIEPLPVEPLPSSVGLPREPAAPVPQDDGNLFEDAFQDGRHSFSKEYGAGKGNSKGCEVPPAATPAAKCEAADPYGFTDIFSEFKKGVDRNVDKEDTETHYNLGIAYMEMGLYDDAVQELQVAANDPARSLGCLTLQGICLRDKGDFAGAENIFCSVLGTSGITSDESLGLKYELALLYEMAARVPEALATYLEVLAIKPGFRNTQQKIALLQGGGAAAGDDDNELIEIELEELD